MSTIGSAYSVGNCITNLPTKYGNRQNFGFNIPGQNNATNQNFADGSLATLAVTEAIKEMTETYEFEELKYQTPVPPATTLNLTTGNGLVPISSLIGTITGNASYPQFQNQNFLDITDVYTFWIWFSGGPNQAGRTLKYRRVTTIDSYSYGITSNQAGNLGVAPPVYYTRFGNILQVGPYPDNPYDFFVRVKLRHPFPVPWGGLPPGFIPAVLSPTMGGGSVLGISVVSGGAGYQPLATNIPVIVQPPPLGVTASGLASTNAFGVITSVAVSVGGSGYQTTPAVNTAAIAAQPVFAPDSWQELFEIAACQRVAMWMNEGEAFERITGQLEKKITALNLTRTADMVRAEKHNERAVSVRISTYTGAR